LPAAATGDGERRRAATNGEARTAKREWQRANGSGKLATGRATKTRDGKRHRSAVAVSNDKAGKYPD